MHLRHPGALAPLAALALIGIGCGASEPSGDAEVTVHASLPLSGPLGTGGRDALDGAGLALADADSSAGGVAVRLEPHDDATAGPRGALPSPVAAAANARAASEDSTAVAYLGELLSGATRASLPVTNEARMLQVSPAAGAPDLVAEVPGGEDPGPFQPTGERTFARLVPSDERQASAAALLALERGAATAAVADDATRYGRELADGFRAAAEEAGLRAIAGTDGDGAKRSPRRRRALYFATDARGGITPALDAARSARAPTLLLPDAALERGFLDGAPATGLSPRLGAPETLAIASTLDPAALADPGGFTSAFRERYGRDPGRYAAYGYEAMASILEAIDRASDPTDRQAVIDAFFAGEERDGVVGAYSITELGETTLDRMTAYRLDGGRWLPEREIAGP